MALLVNVLRVSHTQRASRQQHQGSTACDDNLRWLIDVIHCIEMPPKTHPLAEVFGFPTDNFSDQAERHRTKKLCPFNNKVPNCTKDKANNPLGVCSIYEKDTLAITCPVRFRQEWIIADHSAEFFFPKDAKWSSLTEVRLKDKNEKSAGNIDLVIPQSAESFIILRTSSNDKLLSAFSMRT